MNAVWQRGPQDRSARMLLLAIADNANDRGEAFPSQLLLGQKACMSKSTVIRTLHDLEAEGWLAVEERAAGADARGNLYCITLTRLGLLAPVTAPQKRAGQKQIGVTMTPKPGAEAIGVTMTPICAGGEVSKTGGRGVKTDRPPTPPLVGEPSGTITNTPLPPTGGEMEPQDAEKRVHREQAAFLEQQLARARARGVEPVTRPAPIACVDTGADPPLVPGRRRRRWTPAMIGARM